MVRVIDDQRRTLHCPSLLPAMSAKYNIVGNDIFTFDVKMPEFSGFDKIYHVSFNRQK
jgi:hypothetical protein